MNRASANQPLNLEAILARHGYWDEVRHTLQQENLLSAGRLNRLQAAYLQHSGIADTSLHLFTEHQSYAGRDGLRQILCQRRSQGLELQI